MAPVFIRLEEVLAIHEDQISEHGGSHGVRDQSLLESALAARDKLAGARQALGKALVETGKPRAALAHLLRVEREEPDGEQVHFLLAQAYRALGMAAEAAKEMALHEQVTRKLNAR